MTKSDKIYEMFVPNVGESINEVTISSWLKSNGDYVELDEIIAEIDSDKATFELTAEASGNLIIEAEEGTTLEIGKLICKIEIKEISKEQKESQDQKEVLTENKSEVITKERSESTPVAKKIMDEKGIDPKEISGTGAGGKITKEDVINSEQKVEASSTADSSEVQTVGNRNQRREKMTQLRKTISKRLVSVKNETAMLTTFNEVNMEPIMNLRKKYKESFKEKYEVNLGFMSFFTKACCVALSEWPAVNALLDENEIVYNDYCDISIAVSTPKGLVVPVIRNAESLSFDQIEKEIIRLATKARDGKLSIEEMQGGTFTITNGGIFGSMMSTPIINSPQSAILGMHNIVKRTMVVNDEIKIKPMMYLALSYDHRIIDGRESVSFLVRLKELLEDPSRLMLKI
ncbi:MAG: dihydrolipoyllysine-residue succinyltransferase [Flammeovirgaceae bacterium]|nr:dihydrolipoyllysine-residue succinyltransferase [Flammeovirgaceae bacterium]|tara:strand:- start:24 stop:1229 length:1206 start_codon:yes stop_codon:yes gene_type:complete